MFRLAGLMALAAVASAASIGNDLHVGFSTFAQFPTTTSAATSAGYVRSDPGCDPLLGIAYNNGRPGPSKSHPHTLYFTADGKVSGIATTMYGTPESNLVTQGFWVEGPGSGAYTVYVAFRGTGEMCAQGGTSSEPLGDRLLVNPRHVNYSLPLSEAEAAGRGWTKGACIDKMGRHWALDLATAPKISYDVGNLVPILPMYHVGGGINAFLVTTSDVQQSLLHGAREWDSIALPAKLMSLNFCPSSATGSGSWDSWFFSTGHVFLASNPQSVSCPNGCSRCCIKD